MIMETTTDANGHFSFPGWGPKKWDNGRIETQGPGLKIFKPGYEFFHAFNPADFTSVRNNGTSSSFERQFNQDHRTSDWNGKRIPLKPIKDNFPRVAEQYGAFFGILKGDFVSYNPEQCNWKYIVHTLKKQEQIRQQLIQMEAAAPKSTNAKQDYQNSPLRGQLITTLLIKKDKFYIDSGCGSTVDVFQKK